MNDLPVGWAIRTPLELAGNNRSSLVIGPFGSSLRVADYRDRGVPLIFVRNIREANFSHEASRFISRKKAHQLKSHEVIPGDVLITKMGDPPGDACVYSGSDPGIITADCIRLRAGDGYDRRYIAFAINSPQVRRQIEDITRGVAQRKVSLARFREGLRIPAPPLEIQIRIVDILEDHLSRLDSVLTTCRTTTQRLIRLRQAELNAKFGVNGSDSVPLGDLLTGIQAGRSLGGSAPPAAENEWGIIKVSAMTWGEFRPYENKGITESQANRNYEIARGDLLVSRANTSEYVGAPVLVGQVRPRLLLSDKSLRLLPKSDVDPEWLWRALQAPSARRQISAAATGTKDSMRNISQRSLMRIRLPKVEPEVQRYLAKVYAERDSEIRRIEQAAATGRSRTATLRRSVLMAAFSGNLNGLASDVDRIEELAGV